MVEGPKEGALDTEGLEVETRDMPLQYDALQLLVNPNVAFLLILVGLLGLAIELFSPGLLLPGGIGLVSFVLGLYGTAQLPVTAAGIILLVTGIVLIIAEAHLPTNGILGIVGIGVARGLRAVAVRHRRRGLRGLGPACDRHRDRARRAAGAGDQEGGRGAARPGSGR